MAASCLGVSAADLDLLGGGRSEGGAANRRRLCGKISQIQSLLWGVIARGEVHYAREEAEAIPDLSTWLDNRGVFRGRDRCLRQGFRSTPRQCQSGGITARQGSGEFSWISCLENPTIRGSVGAPGGEDLVLACDVLCCGFPSRTVPESILPFMSEAALHEVPRLLLREQLRRFLQLLPAGFYTY